ncbi:MAG: sigma-70 family RNA polymerase sigma factor [Myxococcota bacterium]
MIERNRSKDRESAFILRGVAPRYPELPHERVALALRGDRAAFAEVYQTYEPAVRLAVVAAIRHRPALEGELEDFIGEIWARFVADGGWRLRSYDPERGSFGYYLRMRAFAIARALASQRVHQNPTVAMTDPLVSLWRDDGLEGRVLDRDALQRLWVALQERLGPVDLALFQGVFVEGRLVREVGDELGLSEAVAYRRSHRLKQKIERIADELRSTGALGDHVGPASIVLLASALASSMPYVA